MLRRLLAQLALRRRSVSAAEGSSPRQGSRERVLAEAARLHRSHDYPALATHCRQCLARHGDEPDLLTFLASALAGQGKLPEATEALQRALALRPEAGEARLWLARLLVRDGRVEAATEAYRQALARPAVADIAGAELAGLLNRLGRYDEAEACARSFPHSRLAAHELARTWFEQGRVDEAIALLRSLVAASDTDPQLHSDLLRALNYTDKSSPEEIFQEHRAWASRHADVIAPHPFGHDNERSPERRLRVGFVSPHFRKHAVTFFLESVLDQFERERIEVVLYSDAARHDEYSERLRAVAALWRETGGLDDEDMAALIRRDLVDVLIDLSGHTPGNRLLVFARRPAPLQVTWNGYPNTTGMQAMGYRVTDACCDPPGETEHLHTERLVRLPAVYMSWHAPRDAPDPTPLPCARTGQVTFASFNACYKLTATTLDLWRRILDRTPASRLLLVAVPPGIAQQRVRAAFEEAGIASSRLDFRGRVEHEAFLDLHAQADIALDPYPYHGTTTTCFSLWMGVPVVTLAGRSHVSRVGATLLTHAGLPGLIARNGDEYVRIACELATDIGKLAGIRAGLRPSMAASPLTDGAACARALQEAWRSLWQEWCAARP